MRRVMSNEDQTKSSSWSTMEKKIAHATGFVFEKPKDRLLILTAAHTIQEAYREKSPLDSRHVVALNRAYYFDVICIHKGREFQLGGQGADEDNVDNYLAATIVAISSSLDLMILQVDHAHLGLICNSEHNTISGIAELTPPRGEPVLLQGWPENRCDTSVWGYISTVRDYRWLTRENPLGYRMRLTELPGLECERGCSGGPLVDGRLQCVGVCHANLNCCGYAVSVPDIRNFLRSCGVMVHAAAAAAAAREGHDDSKAKHDGAAKGKGLQQGQGDNKKEHERQRGKSKDEGVKKQQGQGDNQKEHERQRKRKKDEGVKKRRQLKLSPDDDDEY